MLKQEQLEKLKKQLQKQQDSLQKQLATFAKEDKKTKGDWETKYPNIPSTQSLEDEADEVEEFFTRLPVEHSLELQLAGVKLALAKMAKGEYGKCEKCASSIAFNRLKANPAAKTCSRCK